MCDYQNEKSTESAMAGRLSESYSRVQGQSARHTTEALPTLRIVNNADVVAHHAPDREQIQRITTIRSAARNFLDAIDANCPASADATAAKRKVREAIMTANAAIVLNGLI